MGTGGLTVGVPTTETSVAVAALPCIGGAGDAAKGVLGVVLQFTPVFMLD